MPILGQQFGFVTRLGNTGFTVNDIAGSKNGQRLYVTGQFSGNGLFGTESASVLNGEAFLTSLNTDGTVNWVVNTTSTGGYEGSAVETDRNGNVVMCGFGNSDITIGSTSITHQNGLDGFVIKYDSDGNILWAAGINGSSGIEPWAINTDSEGSVYVGGLFEGSLDFDGTTYNSAGGSDMFLVKYDRNGNEEWIRTGTGTSNQHCTSIAIDASDNIYLTGFLSNLSTFGSISITSIGGLDSYIAKLDKSGNYLWIENHGGGGTDIGHDLTIDNNDDIVVAMASSSNPLIIGGVSKTLIGNNDIAIAKFDNDGTYEWHEVYGSTTDDQPRGVYTDSDNNIFMGGYATGDITINSTTFTHGGGSDVFALKTDAQGTFQWAKMQDIGNSEALGIYADRFSTAYLAGVFSGSGNLDGNNITATGGTNGFVTNLFEQSPPQLASISLTSNNPYSVNVSSSLQSEGNSAVSRVGYVWDTSPNPTLSLDTRTQITPSLGSFAFQIDGLTFNTTYYVRAFAQNSQGTFYSQELQFRTGNYPVAIDGNQDFIPDSTQRFVITQLSEITGNYITVESQDTTREVSDMFIEPFMEPNYSYPLGRIGFRVLAAQAEVKLYFHGETTNALYSYRKTDFRNKTVEFQDAELSLDTLNGVSLLSVTLQLTDGGAGDADNTVNGVINDPGGPALLSSSTVIPVWDYWWVLLLASLGYMYYRRFG